MDRAKVIFSLADPTKQSVVGPDKKLPRAIDYDSSACGSYAGVDNRYVDSARGEIVVYSQQIESGRPDILGWNLVGDIHDARVGVSRKDRAFHRADKIILRAKISQESD